MPKFLICTIVSIALILMSSCKHKEQESVKQNPIEFDTIYVTRNYHINNDSTKPSCNLKIIYTYPKTYPDRAILDSIQHIFNTGFFDESYINNTPQEAVDNYTQSYINNYKRDFDIFFNENIALDDSDKYFSYYETLSNQIKYNKDNILTFQVLQTNYKGGADSYQYIKNYSIDLESGLLITESDIFKAGFENALTPIFKDLILKINQVKTTLDLDNLGYFGIDEIIPNGNILVDNQGITYIFNKGEYSAYKLDPISLTIPYSELSSLIKEDSPVSKFLEK